MNAVREMVKRLKQAYRQARELAVCKLVVERVRCNLITSMEGGMPLAVGMMKTLDNVELTYTAVADCLNQLMDQGHLGYASVWFDVPHVGLDIQAEDIEAMGYMLDWPVTRAVQDRLNFIGKWRGWAAVVKDGFVEWEGEDDDIVAAGWYWCPTATGGAVYESCTGRTWALIKPDGAVSVEHYMTADDINADSSVFVHPDEPLPDWLAQPIPAK